MRGFEAVIPASTRSFPSEPVSTAMLPPDPSSTLTFPRSLCTAIFAFAASLRTISTIPLASAKTSRGVSQAPVAAAVAPRQHRQKPRRETWWRVDIGIARAPDDYRFWRVIYERSPMVEQTPNSERSVRRAGRSTAERLSETLSRDDRGRPEPRAAVLAGMESAP